jgi:hypothetical protein
VGTRENNPISSSNRIREIKRDLDFSTRMIGNRGADRLRRGHSLVIQESLSSGAPVHIPSPAEYIRSTRIKEKHTVERPGISPNEIGRQSDFLNDMPSEVQVKAFEDLKHT